MAGMTSLPGRTAERLLDYIAERRLAIGDRLPPEHELTATLSVSRTVLREAVAGLKAQGLLTSRRGSGVYVAQPGSVRLAAADASQLPDVVKVLELRAAVEIEAAGLAAQRRSDDQLGAIESALDGMAVAVDDIDPRQDLQFHLAVAAATNNEHFSRFLEQSGALLIPRHRVRLLAATGDGWSYGRLIDAEHRAIAKAIAARDVTVARAAMRQHLLGSARRYAAMAAAARATP